MTEKIISKQIKNICFGAKNPKQIRDVLFWDRQKRKGHAAWRALFSRYFQ
ncbi:MAG: hypothetical protein MSH66_00520 [Bacteroidales bacterium]|nr:hypothetical protein [Bacteroidales bacterium]